MISAVLWISSNEATLIRFTPSEPEIRHFRAHGPQTHAAEHGKHHTLDKDHEKFFHQITEDVFKHSTDRVLLVGPGPAKTRFHSYLEKHAAQAYPSIVAVKAIERVSDGELADFAHRFFRKADTFDSLTPK